MLAAKAESYISDPNCMYNSDNIPYIQKVLNHTTANVTILSCNAGHKNFDKNVMTEFDIIANGTVTGFDGSVSFYNNNYNAFFKRYKGYGPILSDDQGGFYQYSEDRDPEGIYTLPATKEAQ